MKVVKSKKKNCQECRSEAHVRLELAGGCTYLCDNCLTRLVVKVEDAVCRGVYSVDTMDIGEGFGVGNL